MAENDIIVAKEGSSGTLSEIALAPSDIGAANASHTHTAADIDSGASAADTFLQSNGSGGAGWNTVSYDDLDDVPSNFTPSTHASSHATGGSDAIAPSDIGAQSLFTTTTYNITSSGSFTLTASRAQIAIIQNYSGAKTVTLPTTGNLSGDVAVVRANPSIGTLEVAGSVGGNETVPTTGSRRYVYDGSNWQRDPVYTHEHSASDITSGILDHQNGGLEANVSAYDGLVKISGGSTSAVTVTTAGEALLDDADAAAQRTTLGLGNSATLDTGTTAGTVAEGDHTHADLHTRSHAITSTSDHTAGNHKVFYSDGSGNVQELALGNSGEVLTSNGATSAPSFAAASGGDTVTINASAADVLSVASGEISAVDATADKIVFWDDSASELTYLALGSGLSITDQTISATASSGSKSYAVFTATDNQPPSTAFATLDTRNSIAVLDYDDATDESAVFVSIMPEGASLGSGLKIRLHWMATTATSGNCVWDVSLERMTTDLDSDSFDTIASATATANGTSGILTVTEITLTTIDSVTAGDGFRLKVTRDANNASDTMTGDAELIAVEVRSAA